MAYQPQSIDTSEASDRYFFQLLRQKTLAERFTMAAQMIRWAKAISLRGIEKARGHLAPEYFAQAVLQDKWTPALTPTSHKDMWIQDPGEIAQMLHEILESLSIAYYITGGVAAIAYGEPRTTRDLDIVVEVGGSEINTLVTALEAAGFYCPHGAVEDIQSGRGRVLSITHMQTLLNADIVLNANTDFDRSKLARRRLEAISLTTTDQFWMVAPEDLILAKLLWGQRSQSEKQWRDVLGVLKVQHDSLEFDYLRQWGTTLGIRELLETAIAAAA